jgi:hypothetical protein
MKTNKRMQTMINRKATAPVAYVNRDWQEVLEVHNCCDWFPRNWNNNNECVLIELSAMKKKIDKRKESNNMRYLPF